MATWSEQRDHERAMKEHRRHYGAQHMQAIREGKVKQDSFLTMIAPFLGWLLLVGGFLFIMGVFVAAVF